MTERPRLQTSLQTYLQGIRRHKIIEPTQQKRKWKVTAERAYRHSQRQNGTEWYVGVQSYQNVAHQILIQVTDAQMIMIPGSRFLKGLDLYLLIVGGTVSVSEMQLPNYGIIHLLIEKGSPIVKGRIDLGQGTNQPFSIIGRWGRKKFHPFHLLIPR